MTDDDTTPPAAFTAASASLRGIVAILPVNTNDAPPRSIVGEPAAPSLSLSPCLPVSLSSAAGKAKSAGVNALIIVSTAKSW